MEVPPREVQWQEIQSEADNPYGLATPANPVPLYTNEMVNPGKVTPENADVQVSPGLTGHTSVHVPVVTISPADNGVNCDCIFSN